MSNGAVIPFNANQLPARALQRLQQGKSLADHMSEGVGAPMDFLSIRGKNFHERIGGEEITTPRPVYEYDVVIIDGTPNIGKTYYINQYQQGSMAPPDCWSLNGVKPDPQSPAIQAPTCRGCKWNVFGSRIMTDRPGQQSKSKACADSRRLALMPIYRLCPADGSDPNPMMLRVPATSLQALKVYAQGLERMGIPVNAVVTRLGFEAGPAHPVLTFAVVAPLSEPQFDHVEYLSRPDPVDPTRLGDERVRRILEAPPVGEEIDPSETVGQQITNRLDAPPAQPAAQAPTPSWTPGVQAQTPVERTEPIHQTVQDTIITLPDGKRFDTINKRYVEDEPEQEVGPPEGSITLPDGKIFVPSTGQYWEPPVAAKPISERAKAKPLPVSPATPAGAPQTGWRPAAAGGAPGPNWRPPAGSPETGNEPPEGTPDFLKKGGPVIQGEVVETPAEATPATPKRRRAPPAVSAESTPAATEASASLDQLLSGLELDKK